MTEVETYVIEYDDVPPSMNTNAVRSHWSGFQKQKKRWEGLMASLLMKERVPKGAVKVTASASLRFRIKRKRDEGNFRNILEKALGDALQLFGVIADDDPEHFEFNRVSFEDERGPHRTRITLHVER